MYKAIAKLPSGEQLETMGTFAEVVAWVDVLAAMHPGATINIDRVGE